MLFLDADDYLLNNAIKSFANAVIDLTERRRAEERLRNTEMSYRAIFDAANDAIVVHDIHTGAMVDANQKMCELFGYSVDEFAPSTSGP